KIAQSDQTNTLRSLFDLSKIRPSERNPARFEDKFEEAAEVGPGKSYSKLFPAAGWDRSVTVTTDEPARVYLYPADNAKPVEDALSDGAPRDDLLLGGQADDKIVRCVVLVPARKEFKLAVVGPKAGKVKASVDLGFNWPEFEKFCRDHPQLVRRLHDGVRME